jgi:hypothetical protein
VEVIRNGTHFLAHIRLFFFFFEKISFVCAKMWFPLGFPHFRFSDVHPTRKLLGPRRQVEVAAWPSAAADGGGGVEWTSAVGPAPFQDETLRQSAASP